MDLRPTSSKHGNNETSSNGPNGSLYLKEEDDIQVCSEKLSILGSYHIFVIQKRAAVDYFSSNVTHDIMDHRKNIILKAFKSRSLFKKKSNTKISVRNLRSDKLFGVTMESTQNMSSTVTEATVYINSKIRVAHVEKYGGTYSAPCYEVFNSDRKTAFTIDPAPKKSSGNMSTMLDYDICTKKGVLGNIMMKTGLNCILSTDVSATPLEKATLIAVILAMDYLKTGSKEKETFTNQYLFQ